MPDIGIFVHNIHKHINKLKKFQVSQFINLSEITHTMSTKGAIYYTTLQGYIIFETDLYILDMRLHVIIVCYMYVSHYLSTINTMCV